MPRGSMLLLLLAALWSVTTLGTVLLLLCAWRQLAAERVRRRQLERCAHGDHLDTLDTRVDGLPHLAWRCVACGERVMLGVAYATGSNRRRRRRGGKPA